MALLLRVARYAADFFLPVSCALNDRLNFFQQVALGHSGKNNQFNTPITHFADGLALGLGGRELLAEKGYPDLGRICLTHSFPSPDLGQYIGHRDAGEAGEAMIREALLQVDELDRLIQLCDAICMAEGVVLMEVRLVDVALRHGLPGGVVGKWRAFFDIKRDFERRIGRSIYALFPEVASLSVR